MNADMCCQCYTANNETLLFISLRQMVKGLILVDSGNMVVNVQWKGTLCVNRSLVKKQSGFINTVF